MSMPSLQKFYKLQMKKTLKIYQKNVTSEISPTEVESQFAPEQVFKRPICMNLVELVITSAFVRQSKRDTKNP